MAKTYEQHPEYSKLPATGQRAKELGESFYFTGNRCVKGHLSTRYTSSGNCVQCIAEKRGRIQMNPRRKLEVSVENRIRSERAMDEGHLVYEAENPCKHGHYVRYVSSHNCRDCQTVSKERDKEKWKWGRVKKLYGIEKIDFEMMMSSQNWRCSICSTDLNEKNTHIDHCHTGGFVRSLLCSRCNQAIGLLDEDLERIQRAADYIRRFSSEAS